MDASPAHQAVECLLDGVASRDLRRVAAALAPDVTWQNVPHPPTIGRDAVVAMLGGIITWSDDVGWDVVSASTRGDTAWVERVDRFVIGGSEHAVRCNAVVRVDGDGAIVEVRDYVDLSEWRQRITSVLTELAARPAIDVVRRHLDAVASGDPVRMAADYALDATLERGADIHRGWMAIADYFDAVPARLAGRRVEFRAIDAVGDDRITVRWTIAGDGIDVSGTDHYVAESGRIIHQRVVLDTADF